MGSSLAELSCSSFLVILLFLKHKAAQWTPWRCCPGFESQSALKTALLVNYHLLVCFLMGKVYLPEVWKPSALVKYSITTSAELA